MSVIPRSDDADRLPAAFAPWLTTLEARHLADLRVPEVTRALRALSSAYVERRHKVTEGATLDSAGKRAAFALYYAPLHFLTVSRALRALDAAVPPAIVDLGCGTGAAGAAWGVLDESRPRVLGIDRHPWAAAEAARTYRHFGLQATTKVTDAVRLPRLTGRTGVVAAYLLNELQGDARERLVTALLNAAAAGHAVLVMSRLPGRSPPGGTRSPRARRRRGGVRTSGDGQHTCLRRSNASHGRPACVTTRSPPARCGLA